MSPSTRDSTGGAKRRSLGKLRIGVDVGGTFTDLVIAHPDGELHVGKVPSVPHDPGAGVINALRLAADHMGSTIEELLAATRLFVHGSTIATNTVLEGKGAVVGLLATEGFRDTLEIRRGIRADPWDHRTPFAPVLVPRYLRKTVPGRLDYTGQELWALDLAAVDEAMGEFKAAGVESIAICLFNSYANSGHEEAVGARIRGGGSAQFDWLSTSSQIVPVLGEYERTSTTVLNAYVAPRTVGYLQSLDRRLRELGLGPEMLLIQNNGGSVPTGQVSNRPVTLLLSGPAAGVGALEVAAKALGKDNLLSLEIGGTSADVMLMESGQVPVSDQLEVGGYHIAMASVDIHTIGAGGGTIARVDDAGLLAVGPRGAGAEPGPAAYGLGGRDPTVTDALLVLGRLAPGPYAGGSVVLDEVRAREAVEQGVATPLGVSVEDAAVGVVRLLEQSLLQAVERVTLERGLDPSRFTLVPAGGAGPMHGASVGRRLGCRRLYVPRLSGAFCALGMLNVDVRHDLSRVFVGNLEVIDEGRLEPTFSALETEGLRLLAAGGFSGSVTRMSRQLDLRYIGQQWSLRIAVEKGEGADAIRVRFEQAHESRYRHTQPDGIVEITAAHLTASGLIPRPELRGGHAGGNTVPRSGGRRRVYFDESAGWVQASVYAAGDLRPGHQLDGPAIVEAQTTTLCIGPGDQLRVDGYANFVVDLATPR